MPHYWMGIYSIFLASLSICQDKKSPMPLEQRYVVHRLLFSLFSVLPCSRLNYKLGTIVFSNPVKANLYDKTSPAQTYLYQYSKCLLLPPQFRPLGMWQSLCHNSNIYTRSRKTYSFYSTMCFRARAAPGMVSQGLFPDLLGQRSQKLDSPTLSSLRSRSGTPSVPRAQPVSLPPSLCVQDFLKSRTQNSCHYTSSLLFALITDHTRWSVRVLLLCSRARTIPFGHLDLPGQFLPRCLGPRIVGEG